MTYIVGLIAALILLLLGIVAVVLIRRRMTPEERKPNYRVFFITGLVCAAIGAGLMIYSLFGDLSFTGGLPFLIIGIVYLSQSLTNRDKWKRTSPPG